MSIIYHITTKNEFEIAKAKGFYEAESLAIEGFIHCSKAEQVEGVLSRYFKNKTNLVKLVLDSEKIDSKLIYEYSPSVQEEFPHIYGKINLNSIIDVVELN